MHEIIYIQTGSLPNFIGTHFWNVQDAYAQEEVDQQISWLIRETRQGGKIEQLLRPRVLIFDRRKNFGALKNIFLNSEAIAGQELLEIDSTWQGAVQEYREPSIPQSRYLSQLEDDEENGNDEELQPPSPSEVRYWSDFSHIYFSAESIHPIPMESVQFSDEDGENKGIEWSEGVEIFERYSRENDLMDTAVRRLAEDCDMLQAFQGIYDPYSLGGFSISLLEALTDEYPKITKIDFTLLGVYTSLFTTESRSMAQKRNLLSNALSHHYLSQMSNLSIPLLPREMWSPGPWNDTVPGLEDNQYHVSALYAAHLESISWPVRGSGKRWDTLCSMLNGDGKTPFASLVGTINPSNEDVWAHRLDLSRPREARGNEYMSLYQVFRGTIARPTIPVLGLREEIIISSLYPIPLSQPRFFAGSAPNARVDSMSMWSALAIHSAYGDVLRRHAQFLDTYIKQEKDLTRLGLDIDEMREVVESLQTIAEKGYGVLDESDGFDDEV